jgi:hypothetical protein
VSECPGLIALIGENSYSLVGPGSLRFPQVADASTGSEVAFREIGPLELKGVSGAMRLHAASRPG